MNKKVIYTCITGNYDTLGEPKEISKGFDYVCFTDNISNYQKAGSVWQMRPLPHETDGLTNVKKQRLVKTCTHRFLSEYDLSVWVDGNIVLKKELNSFLDTLNLDGCNIFIPQHPDRKCVYEEAKAIIKFKKADPKIVNTQIDEYRKEGMPENYGMLQSCILVRRHNKQDCIKLMEAWWAEIKEKCHRDQLAFNYVAWKNQDIKMVYIPKEIFNSKWFFWGSPHKRLKKPVPHSEQNAEPKHIERPKPPKIHVNPKIRRKTGRPRWLS